jgi:hypothetical protein
LPHRLIFPYPDNSFEVRHSTSVAASAGEGAKSSEAQPSSLSLASVTRSGTEELRERIRRLEGAAGRRRLVLPFSLKAIDRHLPGGGLALGALHEVAGGGHGAIDGAAAALFAAGIAARTRGKVLWCITRPDLFAPALAQAGLVPDRVIYVEAGPHLFRGRLAARRPWRCCSRSRAALHDRLPPPSAAAGRGG